MSGRSSERRRWEGRKEVDDGPRETRKEEDGEVQEHESESGDVGEPREHVEVRLDEAIRELAEQEGKEEKISHKLEEALGDLEKMEKPKETTESKLREALDSLEDDASETGKVEVSSDSGTSEITDDETKNKSEHTEIESPCKPKSSEEQSENTHEESIETTIEHLDESETPQEERELQSPKDTEPVEKDKESAADSRPATQDIREAIRPLKDTDEPAVDDIVQTIEQIVHATPEENRRFQYADLGSELEKEKLEHLEGHIHANAKEIEEQLSQRFQSELSENEVIRVGMVEERLYIRRLDQSPTRLENAYGDLYYYFRDKNEFEKYIADAGESLGLESSNPYEVIEHLKEMGTQMVTEPVDSYCINTRKRRIRGDFVYLMNDLSGKTLSDLDDISKITKASGRGGLKNPKFPEGEKLEVALARLAAIAISDCHLRPNGTLEYYESDLSRIKIVEENLQDFGNIELNPKLRKGENLYVSYFPTPLGIMLENLGIPPGDRTVQNPGLFPEVKEFSFRAKCAFIEDLIPQDGTISGNNIQWTHSNTLDSAHKAEIYGIEPRIGRREADLIKAHGNPEKNCRVLTYSVLDELKQSENTDDRYEAQKLWKNVYENPNRLIEDEIEIAQSIGANYCAKPYAIRYHNRTGRVSVAWTAEPQGLIESIKLGMVASPNDVVKKNSVKQVIESHPKYATEAIQQLKDSGIEVDKWWDF